MSEVRSHIPSPEVTPGMPVVPGSEKALESARYRLEQITDLLNSRKYIWTLPPTGQKLLVGDKNYEKYVCRTSISGILPTHIERIIYLMGDIFDPEIKARLESIRTKLRNIFVTEVREVKAPSGEVEYTKHEVKRTKEDMIQLRKLTEETVALLRPILDH